MVKLLAELAPAKINLFLRVIGRRPDGYHELDSVFVPVSIYDRLQLETRPSSHRSATLRSDCKALPCDSRNLAVHAASAFMAEFGIESEVLIDLHKEIPVGAGLGGGSSDAGAVLRMMASLHRIDDAARLAKVALCLGADVPFFLNPRPARIGGIGEKILPLDPGPPMHFVIAAPSFEVRTVSVFRELRRSDWSGPAPAEHVEAINSGRITPDLLVNDLATVAIRMHPEIARLKALLQTLGAHGAAMSGSGGAVFGLFPDPPAASAAVKEARLRLPACRFFAASSIS